MGSSLEARIYGYPNIRMPARVANSLLRCVTLDVGDDGDPFLDQEERVEQSKLRRHRAGGSMAWGRNAVKGVFNLSSFCCASCV